MLNLLGFSHLHCFAVTAVDSGSKALEFLGLHEQDDQSAADIPSLSPENHHQDVEVNLIITDYCMPGMTGYDLLRKIKVKHWTLNLQQSIGFILKLQFQIF